MGYAMDKVKKSGVIKRTLTLFMALAITSQLTACKSETTVELINQIDSGQRIGVSVKLPSAYEINVRGVNLGVQDWVKLNQLRTYNSGFRQSFDEIFNINTVIDETQEKEVSAKQGCLYVSNIDGKDMTDGNVSLADAFRNKSFVVQYWEDPQIRSKIADLADDVYKDVNANSQYAVNATLNAYYNIFNAYADDLSYVPPEEDEYEVDVDLESYISGEDSDGVIYSETKDDLYNDSDRYKAVYTGVVDFNPTSPLFRNEFYTFLVRATTPVQPLSKESTFGDKNKYTPYVSLVQQYNFLNKENDCMDAELLNKPISIAEAVYMIVQMYFPDVYAQTSGEAPAYSDCKNSGDLASRVGFKVHEGKDGPVIEKPLWQLYTLSYMMDNPDKGMQEELYRAMAVAAQLKLLPGSPSRWYEGISRSEAMDLLIASQLAANKLYGYKTLAEYPEINRLENNEDNTESTSSDVTIIAVTEELRLQLEGLDEDQIDIFKATAEMNLESVENKTLKPDQAESEQLDSIGYNIDDGNLPENAKQLFQAWKQLNGYYNENYQISNKLIVKDTTSTENNMDDGGNIGNDSDVVYE